MGYYFETIEMTDADVERLHAVTAEASREINDLSVAQKEAAAQKDYESAKLYKPRLSALKSLVKAAEVVRHNCVDGDGHIKPLPEALRDAFLEIEYRVFIKE